MAKLPNDIRLEIARKSASGVWKIDELLNTIKFEVEAREASEAAKTSTSGPYNQRNQDGKIVSKIQQQLHCLQHKVA